MTRGESSRPLLLTRLVRTLFAAAYLADLRSHRVARPGGARPQPPAGPRQTPSRTSTRSATGRFSPDAESLNSKVPSVAGASMTSRYSSTSRATRDYYPASAGATPLKPGEVVGSATYIERGQRWMEKEEATSLRDAMDELDLRKALRSPPPEQQQQREADNTGDGDNEEARVYAAALDEAAELVWRHQHGKKSPPPDAPYRYRPHLRKDSYAHARTASVSGSPTKAGTRSFSGSSSESEAQQGESSSSRNAKTYGSIINRPSPFSESRRNGSQKRNISGEIAKPFSGDQIWEEPASSPTKSTAAAGSGRVSPEKLGSRPANPMSRVRFEPVEEEGAKPKPRVRPSPFNRVEIHRNPPSQSRNAQYTTNLGSPTKAVSDAAVEKKNGMEVRGEDIRAATSMRLRDRSPNLPEPSAVSNSPGRPIVSFDANWRAPDESTDISPDRSNPATSRSPFQAKTKAMEIPTIVVAEEGTPLSSSKPTSIPSICVAGADYDDRPIPSINIPSIAVDEAPNNPGVPTIVTPDDKPTPRARPLPAIGTHGDNKPASASRARPLPTPGATGPPRSAQRPRGHWSPSPTASRRVTAMCHECSFPIEGRFVALRGGTEKFHPQCFSCFVCGTALEAMEISPEPDKLRAERLERIHRRAAGEVLPEVPGITKAEDGDDRMRFFCHLDWHELFAPRCKHCTTPILGEHIVALGEHWHYGHFFCAECGDPFDHGMTHIEKDGYAWCVNCQTKRTERRAPKCKSCKTAVIGQYIQALGGEWHEHCFRCAECQGGFDDGQIFPREDKGMFIVLCTICRTRELKI